MRIVVTVPWGERLGGAEAMLQTALDGSREMGHEIEPVFFADGPWPRQLSESGFWVTVIDAGRLRHVHRWATTVTRLARLLRRRQPDIVLNWMSKTQLYGGPAAKLANMKERVVWWQHGVPTRGWMDRLATACPTIAIGCSSAVAAHAQASLRPRRATFVVHPGTSVSGASMSACDLELPDGVLVIGTVGRLQPGKGQDRVLRAHAILRSRGYRVHTLIVGGDAHGLSPEYAASIPALVSELTLAEEVTITGQVDDASPYVKGMDVLISAGECESFGIALLDAMAVAVPVVAVNSGGPAEFIEPGKTGMLARSGEPAALAEALEPLLESPELRHTIGAAGRARLLKDFTAAMMCQRFFAELVRLSA